MDFGAGKEQVMIGPRDFIRFRELIETCVSLFTNEKYKKLFVEHKKKLILTSPIPSCEIAGLPAGKYIKCEIKAKPIKKQSIYIKHILQEKNGLGLKAI